MLLRACAAATLAALPACSTLPEPARPAFADHHVAADFVVPDSGRLELPTSSDALLVRELVLEPAPLAEQFRDERRWFTYAPGTRVVVRARFRSYALAGASPADAAQVFAGAARVRELAPP
jgi:hypothetical protein